MSYAFERWMKESVPPGKKEYTFSRDALEILLKMAWNAGIKEKKEVDRANAEEEEFERKHGPRYI